VNNEYDVINNVYPVTRPPYATAQC